MEDYKEYLKLAQDLSFRAGQNVLKHFNTLKDKEKSEKEGGEDVTVFDLEAERYIISNIKSTFPDHKILSEETGSQELDDSGFLWIIDPIDGTTNFVLGVPMFCVSIGLIKKGEKLISSVYYPFLDKLYVAYKDGGAYLNNEKITVNNKNNILSANILWCYGGEKGADKISKLFPSFIKKVKNFRQLGAASIEMSYIAEGKVEALIIPNTKPWDALPGALIVEEAGGQVTDFQGNKFSLQSKDLCVSNGVIHDEILKIIKNNN